MKGIIRTIVVLVFSYLIWDKWGGIDNELGTFIILIADAFILNFLIDGIEFNTETEDYGTDEETTD